MAAPTPDPSSRNPAMPRRAGLPVAVLAAAGLGAAGVALWLGLREAPQPVPPPPAVAHVAPAAGPAPAAAPAPAPASAVAPAAPLAPAALPGASATAPAPPAAMEPPRFDIVRVSPTGNVVAAGRAAPGARVIVRANGRELGRVQADAQGQWAIAGGAPLPPGAHEITLAALDPAGREIAGTGAVEAVVAPPSVAPPPVAPPVAAATVAAPPVAAPPAAAPPVAAPPVAAPPVANPPVAVAPVAPVPATPAAPIVILTTPQGVPTLLQAPDRPAATGRLGLDLVDYDAAGEIRFAGTAPPGATVRVYVDNAHVGDAAAGADGRWSVAPALALPAGEYRLRLDQVDRAGRVAARVEQPFQRAAVAALEAGVQRVVVQPRQNLWRIARRAYGQGVRYTEIYAANRDVIADPARIYPGQVFTIPGAPAPGGGSSGGGTSGGGAQAGSGASSTPSSPSRSR